MPRCRTVRDNLTAWVDGELSVRRSARIDLHLARCSACNDEAAILHRSIEQQRRILPQLVGAVAVDAGALLAGVRRSLVAGGSVEPAESWWTRLGWTWVLRPLPLALAATALLVVTVVEVAGGPEDVLVPIGIKAPPPVVSRKAAMFHDYAIIEKLEALENFDTVEVEPLEDDQAERG